jgi:hypothetical protein
MAKGRTRIAGVRSKVLFDLPDRKTPHKGPTPRYH